jgi:hypothetical protein
VIKGTTMVEKDMDSEDSAIFVEASAASSYAGHRGDDDYPRTIGAAIQLLEAKLAEAGLQLPSRTTQHETDSKKQPKEVPVAGKLLVLTAMVTIGIASALNNGFGTRASVGKLSSEKPVPGNVVALHSPHNNAFLRVYNGNVDYAGGSTSQDQLPFDWDSERFLIVDAGHGQVAFYNISHRIFLGIDKSGRAAVNCSVTSLDDRPRGNESFRPLKPSGCIQLYCVTLNTTLHHVSSSNDNSFSVVQIHGFE